MVTPNKSLGQHWLRDETMLTAMADAAEVAHNDVVLEIGPGLGTLTQVLVARAKKVVAVEFDRQLAEDLSARVMAENLEVVQNDILKFDLTQLPTDYKVAANIPYYLTSRIIRLLLESPNPPLITSLLVQKEVAERMAATPGNLSILGIAVQFYCLPELRQVVPAALFTPPPEVDSQIIQLRRRPAPLFTDITPEAYFRAVKMGFAEKRKKLRSSLSGGLHISKQAADALLVTSEIPADARPQELTLQDWHRLAKQL